MHKQYIIFLHNGIQFTLHFTIYRMHKQYIIFLHNGIQFTLHFTIYRMHKQYIIFLHNGIQFTLHGCVCVGRPKSDYHFKVSSAVFLLTWRSVIGFTKKDIYTSVFVQMRSNVNRTSDYCTFHQSNHQYCFRK